MAEKITRRDFLQVTGAPLIALAFLGCDPAPNYDNHPADMVLQQLLREKYGFSPEDWNGSRGIGFFPDGQDMNVGIGLGGILAEISLDTNGNGKNDRVITLINELGNLGIATFDYSDTGEVIFGFDDNLDGIPEKINRISLDDRGRINMVKFHEYTTRKEKASAIFDPNNTSKLLPVDSLEAGVKQVLFENTYAHGIEYGRKTAIIKILPYRPDENFVTYSLNRRNNRIEVNTKYPQFDRKTIWVNPENSKISWIYHTFADRNFPGLIYDRTTYLSHEGDSRIRKTSDFESAKSFDKHSREDWIALLNRNPGMVLEWEDGRKVKHTQHPVGHLREHSWNRNAEGNTDTYAGPGKSLQVVYDNNIPVRVVMGNDVFRFTLENNILRLER
ncbi:MAG: hypothetical protein U9O94_09715 [Nanoarchaeota archaeon]|nr:hypothetical protein [Nanoarchaeota archaeon]